MSIRPKTNKEDDYQTTQKDNILSPEEEEMLGGNCNLKEKLILVLEDLDNKIFMLIKSNMYFKSEIKDSTNLMEISEYRDYIEENEGVIIGKKDKIIRIITAFLKAGTNVDSEIYPKMPHRHLYMQMGEKDHQCDHSKPKESSKDNEEE